MRDEYSFILDRTHLEFRNSTELAEAAGLAQSTILEVCSRQNVPLSEYEATRRQCVEGIMAELGQNPMFNDIMDVVAVTQLMRPDLEVRFEDTPLDDGSYGYYSTKDLDQTLATYNSKAINETIIENIFDIEFSRGGDTVFGNIQDSSNLRSTVVHEFTHFAMEAVFKNDCAPYHPETSSAYFDDIVLQTMRNLYAFYLPDEPLNKQLSLKELANAISDLIDPKLSTFVHLFTGKYTPDEYNAEFVVRLPQVLAKLHIHDNLPLQLQICFAPLISYWKDVITPEMRKYIDTHPKGHLVSTDRVYEENLHAHSGEYYLMLEGEKSPADAALALQAKSLITAIKEGDRQIYRDLITSAKDDRLPRIALAQAIEQNQLGIFNLALSKVIHKEYLGSLCVRAFAKGNYVMADKILPHIKDITYLAQMLAYSAKNKNIEQLNRLLQPYAGDPYMLIKIAYMTNLQDKELSNLLMDNLQRIETSLVMSALERAFNEDKNQYLKDLFNQINYGSKYLAQAFNYAAARNNIDLFSHLLSYINTERDYKILESHSDFIKAHFTNKDLAIEALAATVSCNIPMLFNDLIKLISPQNAVEYMKIAFDQSVANNRPDMFKRILPFMQKSPQSLEWAFEEAVYNSLSDMFAQMLPFMQGSPNYMETALKLAVEQGKEDMFKQMLPFMQNSPQFIKKAFDKAVEVNKTELFTQMLPFMGNNPKLMEWAFEEAIYSNRSSMFAQMLPFMQNHPDLMGWAFEEAIEKGRVDMFIKMQPFMQNSPKYIDFKERLIELATKSENPEILDRIKKSYEMNTPESSSPTEPSLLSRVFSALDFLPNFPGVGASSVPEFLPQNYAEQALPSNMTPARFHLPRAIAPLSESEGQQQHGMAAMPATPELQGTLMLAQAFLGAKAPPVHAQFNMPSYVEGHVKQNETDVDWASTVHVHTENPTTFAEKTKHTEPKTPEQFKKVSEVNANPDTRTR